MKSLGLKSMKQGIFFMSIVLLFCSAIVPNEFKTLTNKMLEKRYESVLQLKLFTDNTKSNLIEENQIEFRIWDNHIHYKFNEIEVFSDNYFNIVVYHEMKTILINRRISKVKKVSLKLPLEDLMDSSILSLYQIKLIKNNGSELTYLIKEDEGLTEFEHLKYSLNVKENKPIYFEMVYRENLNELLGKRVQKYDKNSKPVMQGTYTVFNYLTTFKKENFDYSNVLTINKDGRHFLKPMFKEYTVYNYVFQDSNKKRK